MHLIDPFGSTVCYNWLEKSAVNILEQQREIFIGSKAAPNFEWQVEVKM